MLNRLRFLIFLLLTAPSICFSQNDLVYPKQDQVLAQTEILFTWSLESNVNDYLIEVSTDPSFSLLAFSQLVTNDNQITSSPLIENETYYWRIQYDGSIYSSIGSFNIVNYGIHPDVEFWLDPSDVLINSGDRVETWIDQRGNHDFEQSTLAEMPYFQSNDVSFNDHPIIEFRNNENNFLENVDLSFLSEGEILVVMKNTHYPSSGTSNTGVWKFGTGLDSDHYSWNDGNLYLGFGRSMRFNIGNHSGDVNFTSPHITNIISSVDYRVNFNNDEFFSSSSGSVSFSNEVFLGRSNNPSYSYSGFMGDIILFNRELNTDERDMVHNFIKDKYTQPLNLGTNLSLYGFCDTTLSAGERFETYLWSTGETTEEITINESGTYWVEVTDIFGFSSTDTIVVDFAEPDIPSTPVFCPNDNITWNTNLGSNFSYLWSTGETTESIEIDIEDSYSVTITDTNGCVYNSPVIAFTEDTMQANISLGPDVQLCAGNQISLVNTVPDIETYDWSSGETTPSIIVNTTDEYILEVTNSAGCIASDTIDVEIIGVAPDMEISIPATQCLGVNYNYEDLSQTLDNSTITLWNWDFGDGNVSTSSTGQHVYSTLGMYTVTLEIDTDAGCGNSITQQVEIVENPSINFTTQNFCEQQEVIFNANQSTAALIQNWTWDFDDPNATTSSGPNTNFIYQNFGQYNVNLQAEDINGCIGSFTQIVEILPTPQPNFSFNEVCAGGIVTFENNSSIAGGGTISNQQWAFGDGTFSSQFEPSKAYVLYGNYEVNLSVVGSNGCSSDTSQTLKIHAYPQNDISYDVLCAGLESQLTDNSFIPAGSVAQVFWDFGDGQEVQGLSVGHSFDSPGQKEITHRVVSAFGCENTDLFSVDVNDFLSASFEFNPQAFLAGFPIEFESNSIGADSLYWIVGEDTIFNENTIDVIFHDSIIGQNREISLWVFNVEGCSDEFTVELPVQNRVTDLAIDQLFIQESNGSLTVGVALKNEGTTPILNANLILQTHNNFTLIESWEGNLAAGGSENYIFSAKIPASKNQNADNENYICVKGVLISQYGFEDVDLTNNDRCRFLVDGDENDILITPFPNPFDQELSIQVLLASDEVMDLSVYDALGREVATLSNEESFSQGIHSFNVDSSNWSSGTYTIFLNTSKKSVAKKVIKQ